MGKDIKEELNITNRNILTNIPVPILEVNSKYEVLFLNAKAKEEFPFLELNSQISNLTSSIPEDGFLIDLIDETLLGKELDSIIAEINGGVKYKIKAELLSDGENESVLMFLTSYKEGDSFNKVLIEHKKLIENMFSGSLDAIFLLDIEDMRILLFNEIASEIFGYDKDELEGKKFENLHIDNKSFIQYKERLNKTFDLNKHLFSSELQMKRKDGSVFPVEQNIVPLINEANDTEGWICVIRDLSERRSVERALIDTEEIFRILVENSNEGFWMINEEVITTFVNSKMADMLGYSVEEMLDKSMLKFMDEEAIKRTGEFLERWKAGVIETREFSFKKSDDNDLYALVSTVPLFDEKNSFIGALAMVIDITERKRNEEIQSVLFNISNALITTRNLMELFEIIHSQIGCLIDATNFYIALYDEDDDTYSFPYIVDEFMEISNYSQKDLKKGLTDYVKRTGESLYVDKTVKKALVEQGEIEQIGEPSTEWLGVPLKTYDDIIGVISVQNYKNEKIYSKEDLKILEFVSTTIALVIKKFQVEAEIHIYKEHLEEIVSERTEEIERTNKRLQISIGELERAEESLKISEERFRLTLDAVDEGLWDWNIETGKAYFSPNFYRILGYEPYEISQSFETWLKALHPADKDNAVKSLDKYLDGKTDIYNQEFRMKKKSGEYIWVLARGEITERDDNGNPLRMLGTHMDITDRKLAENAIKESEEKFRNLFQYANDAIFVESLDGDIHAVNRRACEMYGYSEEEFLKLTTNDIVPEDIAEYFPELVDKLKKEGGFLVEGRALRKDGSVFPTEVSGRLIPWDDKEAVLVFLRDISIRKRAEKEIARVYSDMDQIFNASLPLCIIDKDYQILEINKTYCNVFGINERDSIGEKCYERWSSDRCRTEECPMVRIMEGEKRWEYEWEMENDDGNNSVFTVVAVPYRRPDGEIIGIVENYLDITEQKNSELELKKSLKEKDVLLKEIHHRVKNNLQIISSLLNLQTGSIEDENILEIFMDSQSRIRTMSLIHEKLYRSPDLSNVYLGEYIHDLVQNLYTTYKIDTKSVNCSIDMEDIRIPVSIALPCGLIMNELITNALYHAFPDGREGNIDIEIRKSKDDRLFICISDDGIGFPEGFDINKSKSLGLNLVQNLTEQLNGEMDTDFSSGCKISIEVPVK